MLGTVLTASGLLFWFIVGVVVFADAVLLATDDMQVQAVFLTTALFVILVLFSDAFTGIKLGELVIGAVLYLAAGVAWSIWKWASYIKAEKAKAKASYARLKTPTENFEAFAKDMKPTASANKSLITGWLALWPFSLAWWFLTWPRRAAIWIYEHLSTLYDRISNHIWQSM